MGPEVFAASAAEARDDSSTASDEDQRKPGAKRRKRSKRPAWSRDEELILARMHAALGSCWAEIARHLPGRTSAEVKVRLAQDWGDPRF
jgi:hypothetical protein